MKITKHAQSCFLVETKSMRILVDPGTYVFELENILFTSLPKIDFILITHIHSDHFDWERVRDLIKRDHPIIFSTQEVCDFINNEIGNANLIVAKPGITKKFDDITIECNISKHGPLPNGKSAPEVSGFVIDDGVHRFYTPGDSIFLDNNTNSNIVAVPFCGQVVMTIDEAKNELLKIKPKIVIPIHYDNPSFPVDVQNFVTAMEGTNIEIKVLNASECIEI